MMNHSIALMKNSNQVKQVDIKPSTKAAFLRLVTYSNRQQAVKLSCCFYTRLKEGQMNRTNSLQPIKH